LEDVLALVDLELEGVGLLLLERAMEDSPPLKRELLVHLSLDVLVKLLLTDMCLEALVLAHENLTSFNASTFDLELLLAHLYFPLLTQVFDLLLVLDLGHESLHLLLPLFSALVENFTHVSHQVEVFAMVVGEAGHQAQLGDKVDLATSLLVLGDNHRLLHVGDGDRVLLLVVRSVRDRLLLFGNFKSV
jgi:hypothetical protein